MKRRPAPGSIAIRCRLSDSEADEPDDGGGDVSIKSLWQVIVVIGRDDARAYCGELERCQSLYTKRRQAGSRQAGSGLRLRVDAPHMRYVVWGVGLARASAAWLCN